eukprot:NODE_4766_length_1850_cov_11.805572.p1 GENE.NODE_4766_length_1850_cov_11.805572~~NODE_4766_length_1850_cov_11.805572.p1  ORF type:complete len:555 (-),score=151.11 NODE_4766_length_1850_cov_11.805572:184-1782(-)
MGSTDRETRATLLRICRTSAVAATMLADYKWSLHGLPAGDAVRESVMDAYHRRHAPRIRELFFCNGGVYIKLGQCVGLMDHVIPDAYVHALRGCFDACPASPTEDVRRVFLEDLGCMPEDVFAHFELEPIASASLAQVHRARRRDGRTVAVKVQHHALRAATPRELAGIDLVFRTVRWLHPAFEFGGIMEEVKVNLPKELDFLMEAENAMHCDEIIATSGLSAAVAVPKVHGDLTTTRILTMTFEEGASFLTPHAEMSAAGVSPHAALQRLARVYCEMAFVHGFLHCDPHPGNVLWRLAPKAPGGFQLVLLDHGLYQTIPDEVRRAYGALWRNIATGDGPGMIAASRRLGIRSDWLKEALSTETSDVGRTASGADDAQLEPEELAGRMFTAMLTTRPYAEVANARGGLLRFDAQYRGQTRSEEQEELARYIEGYYRGILEVIDTLPRALLLLLKAHDCLRSAARRFDVPPSVPLAVTCLVCLRLPDDGTEPPLGFRARLQRWSLSMRCRLFLKYGELASRRCPRVYRALAGA